jgi:hypothetical protein
MRGPLTRRLKAATVLVAAAALAFSAGCEKTAMDPDTDPPTGSTIENPTDGESLSSETINVRGRAEVGATVEILVNDVLQGSAVAAVAEPNDGGLGRFTVEDVSLGGEGHKVLKAIVTDLYGNTADDPVVIEVDLDITPPPVAFEQVIDAEYDTLDIWATGLPQVSAVGRTDTTASDARVRYGINSFRPVQADTFPGEPGEPDSVRFWVPMTSPPLTGADPETLVQYYLEAIDAAGNVSSEGFRVHWIAEGRDTVLAWDDGNFGSIGNQTTGQSGMQLAVRTTTTA